MAVALSIWALVIVFGVVVALVLLNKIEKSEVKRWGASGKLFK